MFDDDDDAAPAEELAPSVDIPDASGANPELQRAFWQLVLVFNAAVFAVSLGVILLGFRRDWEIGGALLVGGTVAFLYGVRKYREHRHG